MDTEAISVGSRRVARFGVIALALIIEACCAPIEQHATTNRAPGVESFVSVGDVVLRVDVQEDLPNVFGRADLYGRQRDRGFSEIRYMGLTPDHLAVFRRRDVDILTNEDTLNRMGVGTAIVTAQRAGRNVVATGVMTSAPAPNVEALPPDTIEFTLDLGEARFITVRGKTIEILDAKPSGIRFVVR